MVLVSKFGGTSVATAAQLRKVQAIVAADPARRFIVPSAPGKAHPDDTKVTDLLYLTHEMVANQQVIDLVWEQIEQRFLGIITELELDYDLQPALDDCKQQIVAGASAAYAASRGEALHGRIVAALLGAEYIDASDIILFDDAEKFDPVSYQLIRARCSGSGIYVIPGFYGAQSDGSMCTFSRGGSDVTGAVIAHAVDATVYENWTDVSGFLMADPRIVDNPKTIREITYKELRELSYMGASVLHEEAIFPVRDKSIPINIRNTNEPEHVGTMIVAKRAVSSESITGVAGIPGFAVFLIEKALMNNEIGFGRRVLDVFEHLGISYEHTPSGIDTLSVVVSEKNLGHHRDTVLRALRAVEPDSIEIYDDMALVATVGQGMNRHVGIAATLFTALASAKVNIRMIDQGSSEQNIIVGVQGKDLHKAICAIYNAFVS